MPLGKMASGRLGPDYMSWAVPVSGLAEISARLLNATKINLMPGSLLTGLKIFHLITFTGPAWLTGMGQQEDSEYNTTVHTHAHYCHSSVN